MKIITSNIICIIIFNLVCFSTLSLSARVGETKNTLEKRLLKGGVAYKESYVSDAVAQMKPQYANIFKYLPEGATHSLYYKSSKNEKARINDLGLGDRGKAKGAKLNFPKKGWLLHVVYINNRVVLESYRRLDANINSYDRNALFIFNNAGSLWSAAKDKETPKSLLAYNYETNNKKIRSSYNGSDLLFYSVNFSAAIQRKHDMHVNMQNKKIAEKKSKQDITDRKSSRSSTAGF